LFTKKSISHTFSVLFIITFILALTFSALDVTPAHAAGILYATPGGTGNCSSWANACTLQNALTNAVNGDEIWVAAGTYKPITGTDRSATFQLNAGVALYGGFAGTETARDQRNFSVNITILSGDIDNNDSQAPIITDLQTVTGNTSNSYHVVTGVNGATLDGFTITAGYANGAAPNNTGGGMYNFYSSPILKDIAFSGNWGGGMCNDNSSPALANVIFNGNSGSGMYNMHGSSPTLTNVTFTNNSAGSGGGMSNYNSSNPVLTNVTFSGNSAIYGGGMRNLSSSPTLTNVTFSSNSATYGGGMYNNSSSPTLSNVTFSGNIASDRGGAIQNDSNRTSTGLTMTNVTLSGNSATNTGGGMYIAGMTINSQIRNLIIWGNTAPFGAQIYIYNGSPPIVSDSVVQSGCPVGSTCANIITADPKLGTLGNFGGFTQTIPLMVGSSAIDAGNDTTCATTDQRGITRPQGAHCDIGAFEYVDATSPIVNSISRINPSPTNLALVGFTVTFSESVTGVDVNDFGLTTTGVSGATLSGVSGSGSTYTVSVDTGSGSGTIRLDVVDNDTIVDLALNPLGGAGPGNGSFVSGEIYDVHFYWIYLPLVLK
jgi:predicted outer membrane repeat protein